MIKCWIKGIAVSSAELPGFHTMPSPKDISTLLPVPPKPFIPNLSRLHAPSLSPFRTPSMDEERTTSRMTRQRFGFYETIELIAGGNMATIYRARHCLTGEEVALKVMRNIAAHRKECELHAMLPRNDSHLVSYIEHFEDSPNIVLAMEYFAEDLLQHTIQTPSRLLNIMLHTARGLKTLDDHDLIHDDLKPENMYIKGGRSHRVVIGDFGGVRRRGESCKEQTPPYCAPEQIAGQTTFSDATMVYGWATSMEKLITNRVGITRCGRSLSRYTPCVGTYFDSLLRRCTAKNPHDRPKPAALLREVQNLARNAQRDTCPYHGLPRFGQPCCVRCLPF
jgi:serine/threonine protein kinase